MQFEVRGDTLTLAVNGVSLALNRVREEAGPGGIRPEMVAHRHFQIAETLIRTHAVDYALRTLDAMQLSVALDLQRRGAASDLVASDKNLCSVAALEGLTVLNPSGAS